MNIQCDHVIETRRTDIVVVCTIIDIAALGMCLNNTIQKDTKIDYQPQGREGKLAKVKDSKTDVSSISSSSE